VLQRSLILLVLAALSTSCALFEKRPPSYPEVVLDSGLEIRDEVIPEAGPLAATGDRVTIEYSISLPDRTVVDSSADRGQPITFVIGAGQVPKGLDEGLVGMRLLGRRRLVLPPELGYGERGLRPTIPPDTALRIDVELVAIEGKGSARAVPTTDPRPR
jgi:FKBP-type peptidyl-prolyl cis-trans isomerase